MLPETIFSYGFYSLLSLSRITDIFKLYDQFEPAKDIPQGAFQCSYARNPLL